MTLQELKQEIYRLSFEDQLVLLETIVQALKSKQQSSIDRHALVNQLRGCLKNPDQPIPTDIDIKKIHEERITQKYLK